MSIKTRIWYDTAVDAYVVSSSYNEKLVESLKNIIPSSDRHYDLKTKFWYVKEPYGEFVRKIAETAFGIGSVSFTSKTVAQQTSSRTTLVKHDSLDKSIAEFFSLLSYDDAKKAYRSASLTLHPDKGGDGLKMSKLIELWRKIEKEIFKK